MSKGQTIVELALTLPFLLLLIVAGMEIANLMASKAQQDRQTAVVVQWAADHPGAAWESVANVVLPGCDVDVFMAGPDLLEATSRCQYHPIAPLPTPLDWVRISSHSNAPMSPTPQPSPSGSPVPDPSDTSSSSSTGSPAAAARWTSASSLAASRGFSYGQPGARASRKPS